MRMPWHTQRPDPIEALLRENRPEPRPEFAQVVLARLALRPRAGDRVGRAGTRVAAAAAVTALALVAATVAAGGVGHAPHALISFVDVGKYVDGHHKHQHDWGNPGWPGNWENSIPVCDKQGGQWVLLHLVPKTAFATLLANKHDFIASPNLPCPPHQYHRG
jgi:hypothetical protein